jgi:hypothetical protein
MAIINDRTGKVKGHVSYVAHDKDGNEIYRKEHDVAKGEHNTVCDLYYDLIADRIAGGSDTLLTHGHAGTSTGQGATDTNLATRCAENRTAVTSSLQGAAANSHIVTVIFTLGAGICTATLTECGLFSNIAEATADMKLYDDSLSFAKAAGDSLTVTWTITHEN